MMPLPKNIDPRIWELTNALCNDTISESEMQQLEELLNADPAAQEFFVDFLDVNAEILWLISAKRHSTMDSGPPIALPFLLAPPNRPSTLGFLGDLFNNHPLLSFFSLFMMIGAALLAALFWLNPPRQGNPPANAAAEPEFVAQLTVARDCQWSRPTTPPAEMAHLQVGQQLELEKGLAQITYDNGAVVLLEGPVSYSVDSPKSGFLSRGKLTARADTEKSRQFSIATPDARFVDLGTEFGVMIDDKGRAAVAVFAGKVNAEARLANGRWTAPVPLAEGEAAVCEKTQFTSQAASRSDFPTLLLPPPPISPFQRWLEASHDLQSRQDLVAYYDFQPDPSNPAVLFNRAQTGAALNGEILPNTTWVEGRFPGKSALEFMAGASGVRINIPNEYRQLTFIAWLNSQNLANEHNGIFLSDGWLRKGEFHWQFLKNGQVQFCVFGQIYPGDSTRAVPADCLRRWCMLAGTIDAATNSHFLYLNGEFFDEIKSTRMPLVNIGSATIGGWDNQGKGDSSSGKVCNLSGRIDELMIFQRVLTADEIKQIYESGKP